MPDDPLTAREFRDALEMHARLTRRGKSYEDVAREVGGVVLAALAVWIIVGAPGIADAQEVVRDVRDEISRHAVLVFLAAMALCVSFFAYLVTENFGNDITPVWIIGLPVRLLFRLLHTATLLAGVSSIGVAALVPGTVIAHLLGLTGG